ESVVAEITKIFSFRRLACGPVNQSSRDSCIEDRRNNRLSTLRISKQKSDSIY
ncbi:hypothetical protein J6590_107479, partial [Homalodisca vitripennis]